MVHITANNYFEIIEKAGLKSKFLIHVIAFQKLPDRMCCELAPLSLRMVMPFYLVFLNDVIKRQYYIMLSDAGF